MFVCVCQRFYDKSSEGKKILYIPSMGFIVGRYFTAVCHSEGEQQEHMYISVDLAQVP